ncbi:MAG: bifunctional diaminohydroxyphosphoribosylaminopyrimidine deaminase/5-amino-6-(5-phosphoribosylamino)uracil reductase RibD [Mangrovibacterium sp.]
MKNEKYIKRCIELAKLGAGSVAPNPMVGAVVVHHDRIIGEGYHRKYGEAHAEVNAIAAVKDKNLLKESTIYVSLEPCAHYGKTPPCAELIIRNGIPRVVVGSIDPFAAVAGKGIEMLRAEGIEVEVGVLKAECDALNKTFFTYHQKKRPYIILKWAQTLDGYIDADRTHAELGQPTWISNELARVHVHKQRTEVDAILIGTNTAVKDNPSLTVRDWSGKQPLRLVIDRHNRIPETHHIKDGSCETVVFSSAKCEVRSAESSAAQALNFNQPIVPQILDWLYQHKIQSLVVEGGNQLLKSFIDANLWDEAHVYIGNSWFGGGVKAPEFNHLPTQTEIIDDTILKVFKNASF